MIGHLGEPKIAGASGAMTINSDAVHSRHPEFHMYRIPILHEEQIQARDMVARHPDLKFIGAHTGKLEWIPMNWLSG